jgi:uncharacterized protein YacL
MPLIVLRIVFVAVAVGIATLLISLVRGMGGPGWLPWAVFLGCMAIAGAIVAGDIFLPGKRIDIITAVYFGLAIGFFLTYVAMLAITPLLQVVEDQTTLQSYMPIIRTGAQLLIGMVLCYMCISVLMQTKDDFRFIIPYVEFAKEVKGLKPYVLDTSVVIDGRIADLVETSVLDNQLIMPRFYQAQAIADSATSCAAPAAAVGSTFLIACGTTRMWT